MRKFRSNGALIKKLRQESDRHSTQKAFSYEIGVSERQLRDIENNDAQITQHIAGRLSELLGVPWHTFIKYEEPILAIGQTPEPRLSYLSRPQDGLLHFPRHDTAIANVVKDANALFDDAVKCFTVVPQIQTNLTDETQAYANELIQILSALTRTAADFSSEPIEGETELRQRVRHLHVLLRGTDVWIFAVEHFKRLPESDAPVLKWDAVSDVQLIVAFGAPGEYGEESIHVSVDNGHPFSIPYDIQPISSVAE